MFGRNDLLIQDEPEKVKIIIKKLKKNEIVKYLLFREDINIGI